MWSDAGESRLTDTSEGDLAGARGASQVGWLARLNRARERWRDSSLTALLVVQCVIIFGVIPATAGGLPLPPPLSLVLLLAFMALTIIMARGRWTIVAGVGTLILAGVGGVLERHDPTATAKLVTDVISLLASATLTVVVFKAAFGPGRFTAHRIRGGVVLYLNIGLLFAVLHRVLAELIPGAYAHLPDAQATAAFRASVEYFSFSTLTSLGFGDIVPVHPMARSLATLEAAIGQLYPPTLLARMVMLELSQREGP